MYVFKNFSKSFLFNSTVFQICTVVIILIFHHCKTSLIFAEDPQGNLDLLSEISAPKIVKLMPRVWVTNENSESISFNVFVCVIILTFYQIFANLSRLSLVDLELVFIGRGEPCWHLHVHKVNNRNSRTRCEVCLKLTIKTPKRHHWRLSGVLIVNFKHISHPVLLFPWLTLMM